MQILSGRQAQYRRSRQPTPPDLQQSLADLREQLGDVHRDQVDLAPDHGAVGRHVTR
jgi:hypothetical protein